MRHIIFIQPPTTLRMTQIPAQSTWPAPPGTPPPALSARIPQGRFRKLPLHGFGNLSHIFRSVRNADVIVVLRNSRLLEEWGRRG